MNKPVKNITYNFPQLIFLLSQAKTTVLEWGRGTGKSTILGRRIHDCVVALPRSTGGLVGASFSQMKTRTLPSTIAGLEMHGFYKDVHYVVGRRPLRKWGWQEPYEPPLDYANCIAFYNGAVLVMVSQDHSASSGRGMNLDWVIGDEALLLDKEKFETDVLLTNRGNLNRVAVYPDGSEKFFKDVWLHHSVLLASTTPITVAGRWFLEYEKQALVDPEEYAFIRASAEDNRENLGDDYFKKAKAVMSDLLYRAEVLNIRIPKIEDSFYPKLEEHKHTYGEFSYMDLMTQSKNLNCSNDTDLNPDEPLIAGVDWGTRINSMVVAQGNQFSLKFINNMYVKSDKIVEDMINDFIRYYAPHPTKELYLWYDPTGNIRAANSRETVAQQVKNQLQKAGWSVFMMTQGSTNVSHELKYNLWNNILKQDLDQDTAYPKVSMNKMNCKELWISMSNAPAKPGRNETIRKDKSSERNKSTPQEYATHLSDCADIIVVGMFNNLLYGDISTPGDPIIS